MSRQTHKPIGNTAEERAAPKSHDTLKPSAAFTIWGIVLLVVSPLVGLPLYSALRYTGFRYIDAGALGFMGFVSVAGTIVGLVLLLIGIYRALTAVHVGAREAARASGRLVAAPHRDAAPEARLDDPNPALEPESTIIVRRD